MRRPIWILLNIKEQGLEPHQSEVLCLKAVPLPATIIPSLIELQCLSALICSASEAVAFSRPLIWSHTRTARGHSKCSADVLFSVQSDEGCSSVMESTWAASAPPLARGWRMQDLYCWSLFSGSHIYYSVLSTKQYKVDFLLIFHSSFCMLHTALIRLDLLTLTADTSRRPSWFHWAVFSVGLELEK